MREWTLMALDFLLRQMYLDAKASGKITYDREKRVMIFADDWASQTGTDFSSRSESI